MNVEEFFMLSVIGIPEKNCQGCENYKKDVKEKSHLTYCSKLRIILPDKKAEEHFSKQCTSSEEALDEYYKFLRDSESLKSHKHVD